MQKHAQRWMSQLNELSQRESLGKHHPRNRTSLTLQRLLSSPFSSPLNHSRYIWSLLAPLTQHQAMRVIHVAACTCSATLWSRLLDNYAKFIYLLYFWWHLNCFWFGAISNIAALNILFFFFFRAVPAAYGSSWARVELELQLPAYTTALSNTRYLIHWARPGIEPASSWVLVGFITCWATGGTHWTFL